MDRFLEEQEGVRDRSSSPNVNYLLYGDAKRQRASVSVTNNDEAKSTETWDGNSVDPLADINGPTAPPPPPPPPPPPLATSAATTVSSTLGVSGASSTPASYCSSSARHPDGSESECANPLTWNAASASRTQATSSVITTITINTTTASTSAAAVTAVSSVNTTVTTSSTATAATAAVSNNYYHQRVTSSRSNDSHDSPSPENILPHLPP